MAFKLPRLKSDLAIVNPANGKPTRAFEVFVNQQLLDPLEKAIAGIQQNILDLQAAFAAIQAVATVAQAAQQAANAAQETADQAGGGTALSGSNMLPVIPQDLTFQPGPQVDLTGVVAGNLTISGSGPQQDESLSAAATISGEFRIVEIVSMVETTVFLGNYSYYQGSPGTVVNESASAVAGFTSARSSTGAVSYRLDANRTDGGVPIEPMDLNLYLFVRRS